MAIKFQTNTPQKLLFPWGDYMDVNGQYGPQFLYTVEASGERNKLYATPSLHRQLQEAQVGPGCVLTITKIEGEGNRKEWAIEPEAEAEPVPEAEEEEWHPVEGKRNGQPAAAEGKKNGQRLEPSPAAPVPSSSGNGNRKPSPEGLSFAHLELLLNNCLRTSWEAWCALEEGPAFSGEDVRAVAITLFLECARKGIVLQPKGVGEEVPF